MTLDGETDFVIEATVESVHISKSHSFVYIVFEISFKYNYRFLLGLLKSQRQNLSAVSFINPEGRVSLKSQIDEAH